MTPHMKEENQKQDEDEGVVEGDNGSIPIKTELEGGGNTPISIITTATTLYIIIRSHHYHHHHHLPNRNLIHSTVLHHPSLLTATTTTIITSHPSTVTHLKPSTSFTQASHPSAVNLSTSTISTIFTDLLQLPQELPPPPHIHLGRLCKSSICIQPFYINH